MLARMICFLIFTGVHLQAIEPEPDFKQIWNEMNQAYASFGTGKYMIEEEITQINHILQAAAIAQLAGAPRAIVTALLFHDVGQVIKPENIGKIQLLHHDHAEIGSAWLQAKGFPSSVVDFVKNHALAKVILCKIEPFYYENLSQASKNSYHIQKGKYDQYPEREIAFLNHPLCSYFLAARKCDDMAKIIGLEVEKGNLAGFECYRDLVLEVLKNKQEENFSTGWVEVVDDWHRQMIVSRTAFESMITERLLAKKTFLHK